MIAKTDDILIGIWTPLTAGFNPDRAVKMEEAMRKIDCVLLVLACGTSLIAGSRIKGEPGIRGIRVPFSPEAWTRLSDETFHHWWRILTGLLVSRENDTGGPLASASNFFRVGQGDRTMSNITRRVPDGAG